MGQTIRFSLAYHPGSYKDVIV